APVVTVWGSGTPRREFLYADDAADACIFAMKHYSGMGFLNVGTGKDISIKQFAEIVRQVVGYDGEIVFDRSRPDGAPQKLLDVSKMNELGWTASTRLHDGLTQAYADFIKAASRDAAPHLTSGRSGRNGCYAS
ncbi:MAG: NAD-dependent epimerase/dehydratase family protein, partial [Xanthobacteraceae bacterium]